MTEEIKNFPITSVGATGAVIEKEGKILLLRRVKKGKWSEWELPGGKLEKKDKTILQSLIREVKEETNLDLVIIKFVGIINYKVGKRDYPQYNYLCKPKNKAIIKINPAEHLEFRWIKNSEVSTLIKEDQALSDLIKSVKR